MKAVVVHTVTYFGVGLLAFALFDYETLFAEPEMRSWLRQTSDPVVALGPALQPLRGLLFAIACYPLRASLFGRRYGWLALWLMLVSVGVFSTFGPAPGSIEGLIYTTMPPLRQLGGLGEVLLQSLLLAVILCYWVDHPGRRWLSWLLGLLFVLVMLLSAAGFTSIKAHSGCSGPSAGADAEPTEEHHDGRFRTTSTASDGHSVCRSTAAA